MPIISTEFTIVRHGETEGNLTRHLQGQSDTPLSANGILQVQAAAARLADEHFDFAYCSDLGRARQTAEILAAANPTAHFQPLPALREWSIGEAEGIELNEFQKRYPEEFQSFFKEDCNIRPPGGESRLEFQSRVSQAMNELASKHPFKRLLLVVHGGTLQRIFRLVVGVTLPENRLPLADNASICRVCHYPETGEWQLVAWNSVDHLQALPINPTLAY